MHFKKNNTKETRASIQGLRPLSKTMPHGLKTIMKRGGHNYSYMINNWSNLVDSKIAKVCYPKNIKTNKELKDGTLFLNVSHGDQLAVEYSKNDILAKINSFFGYEFIKQIRLILIKDKKKKKSIQLKKNPNSDIKNKIRKVDDNKLKKKLEGLIDVYVSKKKI